MITNIKIKIFIIFLNILSFLGFAFAVEQPREQILEGQIKKIKEQGQIDSDSGLLDYQILEIDLDGKTIQVKNQESKDTSVLNSFFLYKKGDKVRVQQICTQEDKCDYYILGKVKRPYIYTSFFIFIVLVLLVGKIWGFRSLLGLIFSFFMIFKIFIPFLLKGVDPIFSSIIFVLVTVPIIFYISHGFNTKTHISIASVFLGISIVFIFSINYVSKMNLTGLASEEAGFLQVISSGKFDPKSLLLAGILIGAIGILDDIAVGQVSVVERLNKINKDFSVLELYKQAMKVGQDHISSMVNTLILVYAGSSLPLLLLFMNDKTSYKDIIEFEPVAEELIKMMIISIGIILIAPVSTFVACIYFKKIKSKL